MSNLAQEEADRFFDYKPSPTSHPEDKHTSDSDADDEQPSRSHKTIRSSRRADTDDQDLDTDDEELAANMATMTSTKTSYTVPTTAHYANTGPKGVIADAQDYQRSRRSGFRRTLHSISDSFSFSSKPQRNQTYIPEKITSGTSSGSDIDLDDDDDNEFMAQWRQKRLAELQDQFSSGGQSRQRSPGRRTYGTLEQVNANGYLDAVEKTPRETNVVVLLFDPDSKDSLEVEDELKTMAYRWNHIRFVKLHHRIAEMETMDVPAILAYRGGDVFATISGAESEGLESVLRGQGVLNR